MLVKELNEILKELPDTYEVLMDNHVDGLVNLWENYSCKTFVKDIIIEKDLNPKEYVYPESDEIIVTIENGRGRIILTNY